MTPRLITAYPSNESRVEFQFRDKVSVWDRVKCFLKSKKIAQVSNPESKLCIQSFVTQSNDNVVAIE